MRKWDEPRSLHEMFDVKDQKILRYVPDYKINLLVPGEVEHPEKFTTDMRYIVEFLKAGNDKESIRKLIQDKKEIYSNLREDAAMVLQECADVKFEKTEQEGVMNMCKGLEEWAQEERTEGRAEGLLETSL